MTDPRDVRSLFQLLARVVATGGASATLVGCCEVVSLGFSSWRDPQLNHRVVVAERAFLDTLERGETGWVDDDDCESICGPNDGCAPADLALPEGLPPSRAAVVCRQITPGGCRSSVPSGRFPHTHVRQGRDLVAAGDFYAAAAEDEAAAIAAFRILTRELRFHDAPAPLVRAARMAAADEARHARALGRLAERHGRRPRPPQARPARSRSLYEIAMENASEGMAGETVGALLALHQARHARDPQARTTMASVARDEAAHAALAWRVHAFCAPRLTAPQRREVGRSFWRRWDELKHATVGPPRLLAQVGLPNPTRLVTMMG
ncbi:MAG: hypothetical protein R3B72_38905 [Polyangiaceae bacterium]